MLLDSRRSSKTLSATLEFLYIFDRLTENIDDLERNASLRDYFAKTAFLPTTYNKKAIEEFIQEGKVAGMSRDKIKIELEIKDASIISLEKLKDSFLTSVHSHKLTS